MDWMYQHKDCAPLAHKETPAISTMVLCPLRRLLLQFQHTYRKLLCHKRLDHEVPERMYRSLLGALDLLLCSSKVISEVRAVIGQERTMQRQRVQRGHLGPFRVHLTYSFTSAPSKASKVAGIHKVIISRTCL